MISARQARELYMDYVSSKIEEEAKNGHWSYNYPGRLPEDMKANLEKWGYTLVDTTNGSSNQKCTVIKW